MPYNQPTIEFRSKSAPYSVISALSYVQSTIGGNNLPVSGGENSIPVSFRVYNNFAQGNSVATVDNMQVTVFDGISSASHTFAKSPVSQSWVRIYETGFGESTISPGAYTQFTGIDTPIGRAGRDSYAPELGSDGSTIPQIRAGANKNGVGFIEFDTYIETPDTIGFSNYSFAVAISYDWIP